MKSVTLFTLLICDKMRSIGKIITIPADAKVLPIFSVDKPTVLYLHIDGGNGLTRRNIP
jgi:hypothetical protein